MSSVSSLIEVNSYLSINKDEIFFHNAHYFLIIPRRLVNHV